jgi:hypothetical protein
MPVGGRSAKTLASGDTTRTASAVHDIERFAQEKKAKSSGRERAVGPALAAFADQPKTFPFGWS